MHHQQHFSARFTTEIRRQNEDRNGTSWSVSAGVLRESACLPRI